MHLSCDEIYKKNWGFWKTLASGAFPGGHSDRATSVLSAVGESEAEAEYTDRAPAAFYEKEELAELHPEVGLHSDGCRCYAAQRFAEAERDPERGW